MYIFEGGINSTLADAKNPRIRLHDFFSIQIPMTLISYNKGERAARHNACVYNVSLSWEPHRSHTHIHTPIIYNMYNIPDNHII